MLIKDITVLNSNMEPLEHRNVVVKDGRFDSIGVDVVGKDPEMVIDGKNKLLMPGFYNTHCHVPMTLTRGLGEGLSLNDWLTKKMFPFEGNMTEEDCYYGALLGAMELMAGGCVSISDMYFHVQDIARALYDAGMKANICHGLSSSDPHERPESLKGWRNTVSLLNEYRDKKDGRIRIDMGLHAEYTSTDNLVQAVAAFAKEQGLTVHTHISETKKEHEECKLRHGGLTPVQYFYERGMFENPVLAAHCVWLEERDKEIMRERKATVSHCISSNLKLGSGVATISSYLDEGIRVVVATDGAASNNNLNVMEEIHLASLAAKGAFLDPTLLPPQTVLEMATVNGAEAQGREDCGVIETGKKADFIILDLDKPHLIPKHDILANVVYSAQASDIYMTVIDGRVVYKEGEFLTIDRERVQYEADRRVKRICSQMQGM
ncbi:amidohydrolase [Hungatella sp.]|jgi:5-methylthioadenosine/S-adenosylhomocysteine deaminase|uniref:amidohydrolase n=1 Tax=Hungatella sp. TaxID=2613924 RepID=UPI002A801A56|nr:amidohydrolase [Hungatella sp.]